MGVGFNADEVLEIAEQIERNGARFYRAAAEHEFASDVNEMLLALAELEDEHLETFSELRATLDASQQSPTVFDPQGEAAQYLQALADRRIFDLTADPTEKLTGDETLDDVLRMALTAEKDSIIFYLGIRNVVPDSMGKSVIEDIIREEMRHVTLLSSEFGKSTV